MKNRAENGMGPDDAGLTREELLAELENQRRKNRELAKKYYSLVDLVSSVDAILWQTEIGAGGELRNSIASANAIRRFLEITNEDYATPESLFKYLHPDDRQKIDEYVYSLHALRPSVIDFRLLAPDGSVKWVRALGQSKPLPDGWVKANGIVLEVAELKRYEQELVRVENNYRAIFSAFPDPLLISHEGVIIEANEALARLAGVESPKNLRGKSIFALFVPEEHQRVQERLDYLRDRITASEFIFPEAKEYRCRRADGSIVDISIVSTMLQLDDQMVLLSTIRDVTAVKETERALRQSEELFRAFTENLQAAVYTYDVDARLRYTNQFMEKLTGYTAAELADIKVFELVHPEHRDLATRRARARVRGEEVRENYDIKILTKDGQTRWVNIYSQKLCLDQEHLVLGTAIDITDRKTFEQSLQESERKFRAIFEQSSDPMLLLDESGFFDCNEAALESLKASAKAEVFRHPADISPPLQPDGRSSQEKAATMIAEAIKKGFHRFEWLHRDFTGQTFWADVSLTLMSFGDRPVIFVLWRNITAFKEMEKMLVEEREQLAVTLKSIGDAVITADLDGRVVLMNQVAESLTGWFNDEARNRPVEEVMELIDDSGLSLRNPLIEVVRRQVPESLQNTCLMVSRYGRRYKIDSSVSPIRDNRGALVGAVLVFRDVTNAERVQEELFRLRKLESVGRLAGGIAHDFNNLLTGIMGNLDISLAICSPEERYYANLEKAFKATHRASDLTQKLLTFAKGGEPIKKTTSIREIIVESAEFSLLGSRVALHTELPDNLWNVEADPGQISQVIQNLAINAKEAMPQGGNLHISCCNVQHQGEGEPRLPLPPGNYVAIAVRDEGHGISAELQRHIFDPFYSTKKNGSGLGLSVTHTIVNRHGGYIEVNSREGEGTEFIVYLPATDKLEEKPQPLPADRTPAESVTASILVMDDEQFIRELLVETLTSRGYRVVATADGEEAIARCRQEKFDLLIMDMTVPGGLGGAEAFKAIREFAPRVKGIVSSGYSNNDFLVNYRQHGFAGYLGKPYELEMLVSLVARVLQD